MFWRSGEVIRRLRQQIQVLINENDELRAMLKQADNSRDAMAVQAKQLREVAEQRLAALAAVREALEVTVS